MVTYPILKNPQYIDLQKTRVRVTLVSENGTETVAELTVPDGGVMGVNPIWDRILTEFDEKKMRQERNAIETKMLREREFQDKKRKAAMESEKIRILFDLKMKSFEYPFVKNATTQEKSAIRRCPDVLTLNIVINALAQKYMKDKKFSLTDFLDDIEDDKQAEQDAS